MLPPWRGSWATPTGRWHWRPNQTLVPLDEALADRAAALAALARLRGAAAVYAAVAQQYGTTLVTLDRQQLDRLPPVVRTARPTAVLDEMEADERGKRWTTP